jgi:PAS domain S-box-containing protein
MRAQNSPIPETDRWSPTMLFKLITAFVLVALLPMGFLAFLNGRNARNALIEDANQALFAVASQTAASLDTFINTNLGAIDTEARLPVLIKYLEVYPMGGEHSDEVAVDALDLLTTLAQKDRFISSYALLDSTGKIVIDTQMADIGMNKSTRAYFQVFENPEMMGTQYVSPVLFHPKTGAAYLYFSSPVLSRTGGFLGVLRVRYDAAVLQNLLEDKNDLAGSGSFGVLFDEYHIHLAHGTAPEVNFIPIVQLSAAVVVELQTADRLPHLSQDELFIMQLDDLEEHLSNPETQRFFEAEDVATGELINQVAIAQLETQPWLVTFFQPQEIFLAPVEAQTRTTLIVAAFIAAGAVLVAFIMGQTLGRPITQLTSTVTKFAEGDLDARTAIESRDEIGILAGSFNNLAAQVGTLLRGLEERTAELEVEVGERQKAEDAARASEAQFRGVLATAPNAIVISDHDGRIMLVNEQVENVFGYTRTELIGQPVEILLPTEMSAIHTDHRADFIAQPRTRAMGYGLDLHGRRKDGSIFPVDISLSPLETPDGMLVTSIIRDITEHKEFEDALQESEARYRSTSELTSDYIYSVTIDTTGDIELDWATEAFSPLTGYSPAELAARGGWPAIVHPDDRENYLRQRAVLLESGGTDEAIYRIITKNGAIRWLNDHRSATNDPDGQVLKMLGAAKDITESVRAELALKQAKNVALAAQKEAERARITAEAANQAKSAFLANMSHELRTPLNAILGFTQLLDRDSDLNTKQRDQISIINRSGEHLLTLINDVLEMSKIEAGRTLLEETSFDIHQLLQDLNDMLNLRAANKGQALIFELSPQLPRYVTLDEVKLRQVLINLLSNAIKFTSTGGVNLRVQTNLGSAGKTLEFEIQDTGPGIAPDDIASLFEAFVQTSTGQKTVEGTGLGLAISQQFVNLMGGKIEVTSTVGAGSIFHFEIPFSSAKATDIVVETSEKVVIGIEPGQPTIRILIAEDRVENRQLLVELLAPFGFEIYQATNGLEAVDAACELRPDLIWMDIQMPIMDGFEAIQHIRSQPETAEMVIIAITASAFEEDRERILNAGANDFVRKPFRSNQIFEKMTQHLGTRFIYQEFEDDPVHSTTASSETALTPAALEAIPGTLVADLKQATLQADMAQMEILIAEIQTHAPAVAAALSEYAHNFEYDKITGLIVNREL